MGGALHHTTMPKSGGAPHLHVKKWGCARTSGPAYIPRPCFLIATFLQRYNAEDQLMSAKTVKLIQSI